MGEFKLDFAPVTDLRNYLKQLPLRVVCLALAAPIIIVLFLTFGVIIALQLLLGGIGPEGKTEAESVVN